MPKLARHTAPKLRYHRGVNQWYVVFPGESAQYLGTEEVEARVRYEALVARWFARGRQPEDQDRPAEPRLSEVCADFQKHALIYYRKRGQPTSQARHCVQVIQRLADLVGDRAVGEVGVSDFKTVRESWVRDGLSRRTVNQYAGTMKRFFAWGVEEGRIPGSVWHAIAAVRGLRATRTPAREKVPKTPVPEAVLAASLEKMTPRLAALLRVQDLTGMRPGELVILRPIDIDRSVNPWRYTPSRHKTEHLGHSRTVLIGPRAQAVLTPWLDQAGPRDYLLPSRNPGEPMTTDALRHYVTIATRRAGVAYWHPNQLRHSAGTRFRAHSGLEASQASLGHRNAAITEIYAERDLAKAAEVVMAVG